MSSLTEELVDSSIAALADEASSLAINTPNGDSELSEGDLERAIDELVGMILLTGLLVLQSKHLLT
jgi:hypothetical protein